MARVQTLALYFFYLIIPFSASQNAETSTQHTQGFCCHMFAEVARGFLPVLVECLFYHVEERIQFKWFPHAYNLAFLKFLSR